MDWPTAVGLACAAAPVTAAIIKYVPARNGRNSNGVSDSLCGERRETINNGIDALGKRIGELRGDIQQVFQQIKEINDREIRRASGK